MRRRTAAMRSVLAAAIGCACVTRAHAQGLGDYQREVDLLVDTPGTTSSVAGGFFNPAAWAVQPSGGFFFAWDDAAGNDASTASAALSLRNLGFGFRQWNARPGAGGDFRVRDYTLGIGGGTRANAWGLAYGWGGGDLERAARHERLTAGSVYRCRWGSLGSAATWDLERRDHQVQGDLGVRPIGPRLTLFADAIYSRGQSWDDIRTGYGLEARLLPGLAVAGKVRRGGDFSVRVGVALDRLSWLGTRTHLDDDGTRNATTYAIDLGGPHAALPLRLAPRPVPELDLRGTLASRRHRWFDDGPTLIGALRTIDAWAAEPHVDAVLVNLSGARFGPAAAWELRAQLAGLRAQGKRVFVYCERPNLYQLLLASVADEIWLHPAGFADVTGLASGRTYMRRAFDKVGLGVDELRLFTYKSAFEGYSRDSMSEPDREQRQTLIDDYYSTLAATIGGARGIDRVRFDSLVDDSGALLPTEAQAAGVIDSIGDFAAMRKAAKEGARRVPRPRQEPAVTLADLTVDPVWREEAWGEPPRIALLYALGICEMETGIRARVLAKAIRDASEDRRVEAIVLRVDSPGGDVLPSDIVGREVDAAAERKPVIVSQGQLAASGGYWISMHADTILATPLTLTGSIGVIAGWVWNDKLGDKIGFDYDGVQRGTHADLLRGIQLPIVGTMVPDRPLRPDERDRFEHFIRATYGDFVRGAASARGLSEANVDAVAQGRIWSGTRARDHGLVDGIGGLWDGLRVARDAAAIPRGRVVQIDEGPPMSLFDLRGFVRRMWIGERAAQGNAIDALASESPGLSPWLDPLRPGMRDANDLLAPSERAFLDCWLQRNGKPLVLLPPVEVEAGMQER